MKKTKKWKNKDTVYKLIVADIQEVADQKLERQLSSHEINLIVDRMADKIPWYEAIAASMDELIIVKNEQSTFP